MRDLSFFADRRGNLERWLAGVMPDATSIALSPFTPVNSGFSNATMLTEFRWSDANGDHVDEMVIRAQPPGDGLFPDYDLRLQYDVMAALAKTPVPVPKVGPFVDDPDVLGGPCFLMHRVHGEVASGFRPGFHGHGLFFDASVERRRKMWFAAVDAMASLHSLDADALPLPSSLGPKDSARDTVLRMLDVIESQLDFTGLDPFPVLREALRYLRSEIPADGRTALCWGDARPGNIVYRDDQVAAVLDWELAHLGPPEGDLAYFLLVDETVAELNHVPRLPGLPERDETVAYYESRTGRPVKDLEFHGVLQCLRLAAMLVLTVRLSPPELSFPAGYLTDNVPTRRLAELLRAHA
ncbi:phosphotransferase family protein [Streptomyces gilvus]|uniref:phosphotransferase family protein n=1 Tax=Streptomyces gilvus TaxID=2920937 RepID=UPI001F107517|nr:phosphotransferase family protein [Streptomyces sp. CME 23]MCH5675585.1 phosphotransferase family protein [Streptomyces sp. CME 23]